MRDGDVSFIDDKMESEKMEFENIVKPKVDIKTEEKEFENTVKPKVEIKTEDYKIKLESDDEDLQIGLRVIENLNAPFGNKFQNSSQVLKNNPLKVEVLKDIKLEPGQIENFNSNDFDSDFIVKQEFVKKNKNRNLEKWILWKQ